MILYTKRNDVFQTFSYLLKCIGDNGIGRKRRNRIQREFLKIVHFRGVKSRTQIFNDLKECFENETGMELIVRK